MKTNNKSGFGISRRALLAGAAVGATQVVAPFVITARAAEAI
jgi:branched-chain amino acid transport system substrate-binding protein